MQPFDKCLSLAIDVLHDQLNQLACRRGVTVGLRRWWLKRKLRRLEAKIPV